MVILVTNTLVLEGKSFEFGLELKSRAENAHDNVVRALWKKGGDTGVQKQPFVMHSKPLMKKMNEKAESIQEIS